MSTYENLQALVSSRMGEKIQLRQQAASLLVATMNTCGLRHGIPNTAFSVQSIDGERDDAAASRGSLRAQQLKQNDDGRWACYLFVTIEEPSSGTIVVYLDPEIGFTAGSAELGWKDNPERIIVRSDDRTAALTQYADALVAQVSAGIELFTGRIYTNRGTQMGFHATEAGRS